ncbi:Ankyrin repeat and SAM domain-containing protein 3 [Phytophthora pseudosyringae]|uniref:Ankyrin repeat and SAM domain-containing protein 3 n=1 Tax=Phytophthora pseudosyringae TaxID=221518 RepID=A0A8T1VJ53_9STRA|nr:Ankyrin repeat and SAM domain-containing protein 3 [Phytophthora pseudosyringae]
MFPDHSVFCEMPFVLAAENGHLDVLKYLYEMKLNTDTTHWALDTAAGSGFLEMVKWIYENRLEGCSLFAMHFAAANGHLETVKWLHANRNKSQALDEHGLGEL